MHCLPFNLILLPLSFFLDLCILLLEPCAVILVSFTIYHLPFTIYLYPLIHILDSFSLLLIPVYPYTALSSQVSHTHSPSPGFF
jgi:hypothetical protein